MPRPKSSTVARIANFKKGTNGWGQPNPLFARIKNPFVVKISGKLLAYAVLAEGASYQKVADIFHRCGIKVVDRSAFDIAQHVVEKELIKMGQDSMKFWQTQMKPNSIICLDGNWDHKRQGKHCLVSVIDNINWRIIDCEVLKRGEPGEKGVNHFKDSTTMEIHAIEILAERLKCIQDKVVGFCHDCDSKVQPVFDKHGWQIDEFLDINHALLCFVRSFNNVNVRENKCLDGLLIKLKLWTYHCIYMKADVETKLKYFHNAAEHYTGNHEHCTHDEHPDFVNQVIDDPATKEVLKMFLKDNEYIIKQCNPIANTQHNESFNNTRAHKALKSLSWKDSYNARVMAAILEVNMFESDWKAELRQKLNIPDLPPECKRYFEKRQKAKMQRKEIRSNSGWREAERIRRLCQRKRLADMSKHQLEYNINHIPKFHMCEDDTLALVENMQKGEFRNFVRTEFTKRQPDLVEFTKDFIHQKVFIHSKYIKQFFNFCCAAFKTTSDNVSMVYDNILVHYFDELTVNQQETAEEMIRLNDGPNMLTKLAFESLPPGLDEPPDVPEFVTKNVKIGDMIEQKLMFPRCRQTTLAMKKLDGLIVSMDEIDNYPKNFVFPICNSNHAIIIKDPLPRALGYNCEIALYRKNECVAAYLRKAEKIFYPATGRYRKVKVSAGEFATVDISILFALK